VLTEGTTSVERKARAEHEAHVRGLVVVPPFDHPDIIAGQATVGSEILEDCPGVNGVYVLIGGGGLAAGVAAAVKQVRPGVPVIGVEPVGAATMAAALATSAVSLDAPIVAVVSGGNISQSALSAIVSRVGHETSAEG
jgi:threonine dehydratase